MKFLLLVIAGWTTVAAQNQCNLRCKPGEQCELLLPPCRPETPVCSPIPVCQPISRPGTCPPSDRITACVVIPGFNCGNDQQCDTGEKCCPDGCSSICTRVIGQVIPDPCEEVTCPPGLFCRERPGTNQAQCFDPCREARCRPDQRCELQVVFCFRAPCPPLGVCVDRHPEGVDPRCAAILCPVGKECRAEPIPCLVPPCPTQVGCFDPQPSPVTNPCQFVRCGPGQECRVRACSPGTGDTCRLSPVCKPISDNFNPCPVGLPILSSVDHSQIRCSQRSLPSGCPRGTRCTPDPYSYSSVCCLIQLPPPPPPPTEPAITKPGACPTPGRGPCWERCSGDFSCPGEQKCCSNGCGHTCEEPDF